MSKAPSSLDDLMLAYTDLKAPPKASSFKGPPVKDVKVSKVATPAFQPSQKARDWSTLEQNLEDAFISDMSAPAASARPMPFMPAFPAPQVTPQPVAQNFSSMPNPSANNVDDDWGDFQDFQRSPAPTPAANHQPSQDFFSLPPVNNVTTFSAVPPVADPPKTSSRSSSLTNDLTVGSRLASFQEESPVHKFKTPAATIEDDDFGDFASAPVEFKALQGPVSNQPTVSSAIPNSFKGPQIPVFEAATVKVTPGVNNFSSIALPNPIPMPGRSIAAPIPLAPAPVSSGNDKYNVLRDLLDNDFDPEPKSEINTVQSTSDNDDDDFGDFAEPSWTDNSNSVDQNPAPTFTADFSNFANDVASTAPPFVKNNSSSIDFFANSTSLQPSIIMPSNNNVIKSPISLIDDFGDFAEPSNSTDVSFPAKATGSKPESVISTKADPKSIFMPQKPPSIIPWHDDSPPPPPPCDSDLVQEDTDPFGQPTHADLSYEGLANDITGLSLKSADSIQSLDEPKEKSRPNSVLSLNLPTPREEQSPFTEWLQLLTQIIPILSKAADTFAAVTNEEVLQEVMEDDAGKSYFTSLTEVFRVYKRVQLAFANTEKENAELQSLCESTDRKWVSLIINLRSFTKTVDKQSFDFSNCLVHDSAQSHLMCGICLLNVDESSVTPTTFDCKVSMGRTQYHVTCANLWINCVNTVLPTLSYIPQ